MTEPEDEAPGEGRDPCGPPDEPSAPPLAVPAASYPRARYFSVAGDVEAAAARTAAEADPMAAIRELPLTARRLVPISLDLLVRAEPRLRSASFYLGFLLMVTAGPAVALFAAAAVTLADAVFDPLATEQSWAGWWGVTVLVAGPGFVVASVESRVLATAVIAATIEGRPLTLAGALELARRRFWRALAATLLVGAVAAVGQFAGEAIGTAIAGGSPDIAFGSSLLGGVLLGVPFVYALAGVVVGEVGALEAIRRSWRLFRARPALALAVTAFSIVSQFVVLFAFSAGADVTLRIVDALPLDDGLPALAVVGATLGLVFAFGTLLFLAEAIAATPAVHAFVALTHYVRGLEAARDPLASIRGRRAWLTRPLVAGIVVAFGALAAGLASLPA